MEVINIVCDHDFREMLSNLKDFEMDLGKAYTKRDEKGKLKSNITDKFVLQFLKETGNLIYKVGRIGIVNIYTYDRLPPDEIWLYYKGEKYIRQFDEREAQLDSEKYFAELIMDIRGDKEENG